MSDFATRDQTSSRHARAARIAAEKAARKKRAEVMIEMVKESWKPVQAEDAPKKKRKR